MVSHKALAATAAATLACHPLAAAAQQSCVTEEEVSAIAIYSVPGLVQAVRLRCGSELSPSGYLARQGDTLTTRYVAIQPRVWPRAKSGLLKVLAVKSSQGSQNLDMLGNLPDNAVRPLVDALIVQELSPKIATRNCGRIERAMQVAAPIDPEVAGTLLGVVAGIVNPDQLPVCPVRRS